MKHIRMTMLLLATLALLSLGACADKTDEGASDTQANDTQAQAQDGGGDAAYGDPASTGDNADTESDGANGDDLRSNIDDIEAHLRLEARYAASDELSALQIHTDVRDGTAYLSGEVRSDTEHELAEQEAANIEGIRSVRNDIRVVRDDEQETVAERLSSAADDARITATVKARLLASENTAGLQINVDTDAQVVTLEGDVSEDAERELAGLIAANTAGVKEVRNRLEVNPD